MNKKYYRVLTIAGSDSGGGAGIQADLKTFCSLKCFGMSVITALTAQNTTGVQSVFALPTEFVQEQIKSVVSDIGVDAIKIGMLHRSEMIIAVAEKIQHLNCPIVLDPVMFAKSGDALLSLDSMVHLRNYLFPITTLMTPNLPEAEYIAEMKINSIDDMRTAAIKISAYGIKNILIKGGHAQTDQCIDVLYEAKTKKLTHYTSKRIITKNTHGTGCTLSAAIAAELSKGKKIHHAISNAKKYLFKAIQSGKKYECGLGHGPVNHWVK